MKRAMRLFVIVLSLVLSLVAAAPASADPLFLLIGLEGIRLSNQTDNLHSQRWRSISPQTSEVTCGPAALSSLLNNYFGESTTEDELARLSGTYEQGSTSLLGLRDACVAKGYEAQGYKLTIRQLKELLDTRRVPVIVHLKEPTLHYVLVTGYVDNNLLVFDPACGNLSMPEEDFTRRWSSKALLVGSTNKGQALTTDKMIESARVRISSLGKAGRIMSSLF